MNRLTFSFLIVALCALAFSLLHWRHTPPAISLSGSFARHQVDHVFQGAPATVDLKSNPDAPSCRTRLLAHNHQSPTFAGYYCFVSWGCGTECQQTALIDVRDGKVYFGPVTSLGSRYQLKSRLLVANAPEDLLAYYQGAGEKTVPVDNLYPTEYWLWNETSKAFSQIQEWEPTSELSR